MLLSSHTLVIISVLIFAILVSNPTFAYASGIQITSVLDAYGVQSDSSNEISMIKTSDGPCGLGVNANSNRIYVAHYRSNELSVIDGSANKILTTAPLSGIPCGLTIDPESNMIYVISEVGNFVSLIDGYTNSVRTTLPVANPYELAVNRNTNMVYVSNYKSDIVFVIKKDYSVDRPELLSPYVVGIIISVLAIAAAGGAVVYVLLRKKKSKMLAVSILFVILQDLKVFSSHIMMF